MVLFAAIRMNEAFAVDDEEENATESIEAFNIADGTVCPVAREVRTGATERCDEGR
jgi:hypothetical protein